MEYSNNSININQNVYFPTPNIIRNVIEINCIKYKKKGYTEEILCICIVGTETNVIT